ncbi:MAG: hypothetical protein ACKVS8_10180 [Phycisphaerales bacterium]
MTTMNLRTQLKRSIDGVPAARLPSLADYVAYLTRPPWAHRIKRAERELRVGKGRGWRTVRRDV